MGLGRKVGDCIAMKGRPVWNMNQRNPDGRRETSLEPFEIFLRDDEDLKKARRVGIKVRLTGKSSEVTC